MTTSRTTSLTFPGDRLDDFRPGDSLGCDETGRPYVVSVVEYDGHQTRVWLRYATADEAWREALGRTA